MWMIFKKEWQQFFSSLMSYIVIVIFSLLNGLLLFVFPDTNVLDFGYASLSQFFSIAPWVLLLLVPSITMRSLSEEYKTGTFELLQTLPIRPFAIILGKFLGAMLIIIIAIAPTVVYAISLHCLSSGAGIDIGATIGSYIGLLLLSATYTAIGLYTSSFTNNTVVAFILGAFFSFLLYKGLTAVSQLPVFGDRGYYVDMLGIQFHYRSISRGVIDLRDVIYFCCTSLLILLLTNWRLLKK